MQNRTAVQNVEVPIPRVRWYLRGDPVDFARAHFSAFVVLLVVVSVPQIQEQFVESCWYSQEQISSALGTDSRLSRTKKSWKKFSEVRLLVFGTETTALSDISVEVEKFPRTSSSSARRLRQVAANRARAGEKFLICHFPSGSSGTLEQAWRQALEQKSRVPPARPRGDITSQFHSVPARANPRTGGHSKRKTPLTEVFP